MSSHILFCQKCCKFTLKEVCDCGEKSVLPSPPKFSPDDPYASYRRKAKKEELINKGLL